MAIASVRPVRCNAGDVAVDRLDQMERRRRVIDMTLGQALAAQAVVLNSTFTQLTYHASTMTIVDQIDRFTRLALEAQGQCRATVETLSVMKNPPVFARQANIAHGPQQVNNGVSPELSPSRAENQETQQIKLLESRDGLDVEIYGRVRPVTPHSMSSALDASWNANVRARFVLACRQTVDTRPGC